LKKLNNLRIKRPLVIDAPHENPDLLIVSMGSTGGTIDEARGRLAKDGIATNHITVRQIHPFPAEDLKPYAEKAKLIAVVEHNATGQLANLIKLHVGYADKIRNILKYNGNPFLPAEIYEKTKGLV